MIARGLRARPGGLRPPGQLERAAAPLRAHATPPEERRPRDDAQAMPKRDADTYGTSPASPAAAVGTRAPGLPREFSERGTAGAETAGDDGGQRAKTRLRPAADPHHPHPSPPRPALATLPFPRALAACSLASPAPLPPGARSSARRAPQRNLVGCATLAPRSVAFPCADRPHTSREFLLSRVRRACVPSARGAPVRLSAARGAPPAGARAASRGGVHSGRPRGTMSSSDAREASSSSSSSSSSSDDSAAARFRAVAVTATDIVSGAEASKKVRTRGCG